MAKRVKRRKSVLLRLLVLLVSGYMVFTLASLWNKLYDLKKQESRLTAEKLQKEDYISELEELNSDEAHGKLIEKAARDYFGYRYSNEEIYEDISGK